MPDRLHISLKKQPAVTITRIAIHDQKLVYVLCADKKVKYPIGASSVVYIGTTKNGIHRVAPSAAKQAEVALSQHGIFSVSVRIVTCGVRRRVKTWHKLERALLLSFREKYGAVPHCNLNGSNLQEGNEFQLFSRKRTIDILNSLAEAQPKGTGPISG